MRTLLLTGVLFFSAVPTMAEVTARIIVQSSALAGFRHYEGPHLWEQMAVGDTLTLVRERDNPHDPQAVRVEWRGHVLGYVPRRDNAHLARQIDHGTRVAARVTELRKTRNGRNRVSYEVSVPLP